MQTSFIGLLVLAAPVVMTGPAAPPAHPGGETPHAIRGPVAAAAGAESGMLVITPTGI